MADSGRGGDQGREELGHKKRHFPEKTVVVKYMGDTFLDLSYEKLLGHPDKKGSPVPPAGPPRTYLSAGQVESVVV